MPWSRISFCVAGALGTLLSACATTPRNEWVVSRTSDPITGEERCVVARYDQFGSSLFSRTASLYPVVEVHPKYGLLVGVSSGGRYRLPVGDVVWRVDDKTHRDLLAKDSPLSPQHQGLVDQQTVTGVDANHGAAIEQAMQATMSMLSTSIIATGEKAQEMLVEMKQGRTLLFRATGSSTNVGLPDAGINRVGEFRNGVLRPIPLDESFHEALKQCGVY